MFEIYEEEFKKLTYIKEKRRRRRRKKE